jgi:hypothetical protein
VLKIDVAFYLGLKTLEKIRSIVPSFWGLPQRL